MRTIFSDGLTVAVAYCSVAIENREAAKKQWKDDQERMDMGIWMGMGMEIQPKVTVVF